MELVNIAGVEILKDELLANHTSFGIGGKCDFMAKVFNADALVKLLKEIKLRHIPYIVFGDGTNILVSDKGYSGMVIKLVGDFQGYYVSEDGRFNAGSALSLYRAVLASIDFGFVGLEVIGGIPGSVGGACVMNAGERYVSVSKFISEITAFCVDTEEIVKLSGTDCRYEYRNSLFQKCPGKYIILSVKFDLAAGNRAECDLARKTLGEKVKHRRDILPIGKSAGCFFKNFTDRSAGKAIDACGLKELSVGDAFVSDKHANFIINRSCASACDVLSLAEKVKDIVKDKLGLELEYEVRMVGGMNTEILKNNKKKVAVLMGGISSERNISLVTGYEIIKALDKTKYDVYGIDVVYLRKDAEQIIDAAPLVSAHKPIIEDLYNSGVMKPVSVLFDLESDFRPDICFIAMHGKYGEDGAVQGMLEILGIPYTGSGVLAHAMAIDKAVTKCLFEQNDIPTPKSLDLLWNENITAEYININIADNITYPVFVKPACQGSTIGMTKVTFKEALGDAVMLAFDYDCKVLIETFVPGREITVGVLDSKDESYALPVIEIIPDQGLYDLESKYQPGMTNEICPANISKKLEKEVQALAIKAHRSLSCKGLSRTDMIITDNDEIYVLETNTVPGMTPTSLIPLAAKVYGYSFPELLDILIDLVDVN